MLFFKASEIGRLNLGRFEIQTLNILLGCHFYKGREGNECLLCISCNLKCG